MSHAFATLANMGQRPRLTGVLKITDSRGNIIYDLERENVPPSNALDPRIAYILTDILDDDSARTPGFGFNTVLNAPYPVAVKTGTTNDFRDNWTLGYTPGVVVGVWVGNTDGHPMIDSSGFRGAAFEGTLKSWDESAGTVTVVMATGRTVTFDLAKLSEADQSFLKEQPVGEAGVQDGDVAAAEFEKTVIGKALRKMEILEGKSFKKHEFTKPPEFYILYYSASW
jgi:membrane peptidoglycan carboxypeptidase